MRVRVIIPAGYVGPLELIQDTSASALPFKNGEYLVKFDMNGKARHADAKTVMSQWHTTIAFDSNGQSIPVASRSDPLLSSRALRLGGASASSILFFVGTAEEDLRIGQSEMPR